MRHSTARRITSEFVRIYGRKNQYGRERFLGNHPPLNWVESNGVVVIRHFDQARSVVEAQIAEEQLTEADRLLAEWLIREFGLGNRTVSGWIVG